MYISKLHLQGFKSFLKKTDLEFGEGITTIIGPNGCGKSNIVDGIRWILGEQKTTVLRSQKMEDVIFKGSRNQKPLGFCEVSLTVQNNRGRLPIEYDTVEITRRYYRSGESEYLLNRTPCRLKDITGLFMDSGLSSNAYSVIELKMIDQIISHNPEERKKLFEEAAGINYYKQQRQSAIRKLEATRIDLDRVKDIILEVEGNVKNLRLQLKRFERHKKLSSELKSSEILLAQAEIQLLDVETAPLQQKFSEKRSLQSSLSGQVSLDEELITEVQGKYNATREELETATREVKMLEESLVNVNDNLLVWTEQKKAGELRIQQYSDESVQADTRKETIALQIEQLERNQAELTPRIEEQKKNFRQKSEEFQQACDQHEVAESEHRKLQKHMESLTAQIYASEARFNQKDAKVEEKQASIAHLQQQKEQILNRVSAFQFDSDAIKGKISSVEKTIGDLTLSIDGMQIEQAELEEALIRDKDLVVELRSELNSLKSRRQFYEKILSSHEGKSSGVRYILKHPRQFKGVMGVVSDLLDADEEYRHSIEIGLGESVHYLVVDTRENALQNLAKLKEAGSARISIIPLDAIPRSQEPKEDKNLPGKPAMSVLNPTRKLNGLAEFLLQDVRILSAAELKLVDQDILVQYNWVTDEGDFVGKGTVLKSGAKSGESLLGREKQLQKTDDEIQAVTKKQSELSAALEINRRNADERMTAIVGRSGERDKAVGEMNNLEKELDRLKYSVQHSEETLTANDKIIADGSLLIEQWTMEQTRLNKSIESLKSDRKKVQSEMVESLADLEQIRKTRNERQQEKQDARISLVEIEKEFEGVGFRIATSRSQLEELAQRQERIVTETDTLKNRVAEVTDLLAENSVKKDELIRSRDKSIGKKQEIEEKHNKLYDDLQNLQRSIVDRQKVKEENILAIKQVEMRLAELNNQKQVIRNRVRELFKCDVPSQVLNLQEINVPELRDSIASIDRSIVRIGPINMAVADEFKTESERLEFLQEQYTDLMESEDSLLQSIEKVDDEARRKFRDTFKKIAENFKQTYAMFFNGGEAHVRLVGSDDPLESEIEIIARPPGKKTQTIRMLSAGEKALTAISLLFAIYLVKPSPFCILDEVDAPLDDSNIKKFTEVIRQFSKDTQFIIVTHNKLTMEKSDYLYGVTQQEEGVSTIVSVKFEDS